MEGKGIDYKITQFEKAVKNFNDSLSIDTKNVDAVMIDAIESGQIQKFEICAELMWKVMKKILEARGLLGKISPRDIINSFLEAKFCDYILHTKLVEILDDRNALNHIYDSGKSIAIRERFSEYKNVFEKLLEVLHDLPKT